MTERTDDSSETTPESNLDDSQNYANLDTNQRDALRAVLAASADRSHMHAIQGPTGFGKTVVGAALAHYFSCEGYTVLWIANKSRLLDQAESEINTFFPDLQPHLRRISDGSDQRIAPCEGGRKPIVLMTLQQWFALKSRGRLPTALKRQKRLVVIWDECHWAINAKSGTALLDCYVRRSRRLHCGNAVVIGLSATPKQHTSGRVNFVWGIAYSDTLGIRTAYPIHRDIDTGVEWNPIVQNNQITQESLNELATNVDRNKRIVDELVDGVATGRYSRVVIFACNIDHADRLNRDISERGVPSVCLHSGLIRTKRESAVRKFRNAETTVLVNVNEFVEGENVPEIDAVFIARPTASRVLLTQMVGRGSRLTTTKHEFYVVEFLDLVRQDSREIYHASSLIDPDAALRERSTVYGRRPPVRHSFPDHPTLERIAFPGIGYLPFVRNQTFGVEIELTSRWGIPAVFSDEWTERSYQLIDQLESVADVTVLGDPRDYHGSSDETIWRVEHDCSAGWEVISPILADAWGFHELRRVCETLTEFVRLHPDLYVNYRTGMHLTLSTAFTTERQRIGFANRLVALEPGLITLVSPSRLYDFDGGRYDLARQNDFCRPLRSSLDPRSPVEEQMLSLYGPDRYRSVNLTRTRDNVQTTEIRLHNGTTEFQKIGLWISLWMLICHQSRFQTDPVEFSRDIFPGGNCEIDPETASNEDIIELLDRAGIAVDANLNVLLRNRRRELRAWWSFALPRRVRSWEAAGWYDRPA